MMSITRKALDHEILGVWKNVIISHLLPGDYGTGTMFSRFLDLLGHVLHKINLVRYFHCFSQGRGVRVSLGYLDHLIELPHHLRHYIFQ